MRNALLLTVSALLLFVAPWEALPERSPQARPGDYALFFAVSEYQHMKPLANPIRNARDIAEELRSTYGFQTEVVDNPTLAEIEAKLAQYRQRFRDGTYDAAGQLLIFFTGHGVQRGKNGYFVPADGDPASIYRTGMEYDYWRSEIDAIACQHILVTIDACHSITFDPNWEGKTDRNFGRKGDAGKDQVLLDHRSYRARLFITSDATGNETPDRSTLAEKFLLALRSHRSPNGYLTHDELLGTYLKQANPIPGGGTFGSDEPASRFLFFRTPDRSLATERSDLAAWRAAQAQDDCTGYRAYLRDFPAGDFAALARQKTAPCDAEDRMIAAWADAKRVDNCAAYQQFIDTYANSPYQAAATAKLTQLGCTAGSPPDRLVFIRGGTFQMGDQFDAGSADEKPVHSVTIADFYLMRTEVMVGEFADFVAATGCRTDAERGDGSRIYNGTTWETKAGVSWRDDTAGRPRPPSEYNHPVVHVSWNDAVAYCNWLSKQHNYRPVYRIDGTTVTADWSANGYRLPTEAEWEYAARSGGKREKWAGTSDEAELASFGNISGNSDGYERTAPVGLLRANGLGLADMTGNVWEWCWDWYASDYYGKSPGSNPRGPEMGADRVFRGGSWGDYPVFSRAAFRYGYGPTNRSFSVGFRLARS